MLAMRTGLDSTAKVSAGLLNRLLVRSVDRIVVTSRLRRGEFAAARRGGGLSGGTRPAGRDLATFRPHRRARVEELRLVHAGRLSREKAPAPGGGHGRRAAPARGAGAAGRLRRRAAPSTSWSSSPGSAPVRFRGLRGVSPAPAESSCWPHADVALCVCPGETFGLAVLEALASGTPVVTADRGGARELVDDAAPAAGRRPDPAPSPTPCSRWPPARSRAGAGPRPQAGRGLSVVGDGDSLLEVHARWRCRRAARGAPGWRAAAPRPRPPRGTRSRSPGRRRAARSPAVRPAHRPATRRPARPWPRGPGAAPRGTAAPTGSTRGGRRG